MYFFEISQLEKISEEYFNLIDDYFSGIYQPGINKFLQADKIKYFKIAAQTILASIEDLQDDLSEFWEKNEKRVVDITSNSDAFKVIYCGSPSPLQGINFIKRTALYMDTLLIEDPLSFLLKTKAVATDEVYLYELIKHVFNLLDMRKLFFGEGEIPFLVIFPTLVNMRNIKDIRNITQESGNEYFRLLFEKDFHDSDDVFDFLSYFSEVGAVLREVKNPNILFPDVMDKKQRLLEVYSSISDSFKEKEFNPGYSLGFKVYGQFQNLGNQVYNAQKLSSQIVFDNDEYWKLYTWDLTKNKRQSVDLDSTLLNTLQFDDFRWLELIDIDRLNDVRNQKELTHIRNLIRTGIHTNLNGISEDEVKIRAMKNLEKALEEHSNNIVEISNQLKKKVPLNTISIVSGAVATIPASWAELSMLGAISTVYGIHDYINSTSDLIKNKKQLNDSLIGVLFDAKRSDL